MFKLQLFFYSDLVKKIVREYSDPVGYSLSSVARTPRLMSYDRLRACDTTYSRRVSQIYDRSYARSNVRNIAVTR